MPSCGVSRICRPQQPVAIPSDSREEVVGLCQRLWPRLGEHPRETVLGLERCRIVDPKQAFAIHQQPSEHVYRACKVFGGGHALIPIQGTQVMANSHRLLIRHGGGCSIGEQRLKDLDSLTHRFRPLPQTRCLGELHEASQRNESLGRELRRVEHTQCPFTFLERSIDVGLLFQRRGQFEVRLYQANAAIFRYGRCTQYIEKPACLLLSIA